VSFELSTRRSDSRCGIRAGKPGVAQRVQWQIMRIEAANIETFKAVLKLVRSQFEEHEIELASDTLSEAVRVLLTDRLRGAVFLASDPDPIGVAVTAFTWTLEHGGLVAWLDELFVVPAHRGRGVGRQLLLRVLDAAKEAGCRAVELEVDAEHTRAEHLYRREGFAPLSRRRWSTRLKQPGGLSSTSGRS
jgi:GNAT superfamily N-acetyltransferase